jgi:hypothetical protein
MIREYTVVKDHDLENFVKEVNRLIQVGWQPLGSMSVTSYEVRDIFTPSNSAIEMMHMQAMVK